VYDEVAGIDQDHGGRAAQVDGSHGWLVISSKNEPGCVDFCAHGFGTLKAQYVHNGPSDVGCLDF
jgi:hypothetical protein